MGHGSTTPASFRPYFDTLEDPRLQRCQRHNLGDILFLAVCAMLGGANDFVAMEKFGHAKRTWLEKFLELPHGIPSHDTIGRVFALLDAERFIQCFVNWVQTIHEVTAGQLVSLDGKTARASLDRAKGKNPLHVVSAWASENRVALGEVMVDEKSNEITAIPKLLSMLELHGAIVTIDAMGCQKEIATNVRERGADYVLAVKGNQEHLEEDIVNYFAALDEGSKRNRQQSHSTQQTRGHGRVETRWCDAVPVPKTLRHRDDWKDLRSICRVTRVWTERGEEKSEVRYFISSLPADAPVLAKAIRGHWGIENGLHWVLDMYFAEDKSRARTEHAAANLAVLRRWVLTVLRQDKTLKDGIEKKRLQAGGTRQSWNEFWVFHRGWIMRLPWGCPPLERG
jgi:predicted transposase YbfD/YdcC